MTVCQHCGASLAGEAYIGAQLGGRCPPRYDFLVGAVPGSSARPCDIDMAYERNGAFLFIEAKRPGWGMPRGQWLLYDRLARLPGCSVLCIEGYPPADVVAAGWWGEELAPACRHTVRATVARWWAQQG